MAKIHSLSDIIVTPTTFVFFSESDDCLHDIYVYTFYRSQITKIRSMPSLIIYTSDGESTAFKIKYTDEKGNFYHRNLLRKLEILPQPPPISPVVDLLDIANEITSEKVDTASPPS